MKHIKPLANNELWPHDRPFSSEIPKFKNLVSSLNLIGLANNTKWNELISNMRKFEINGWKPKFRFNCIDTKYISPWDGEWYHHLPYPFISVRWFEISFLEKSLNCSHLGKEHIDHSAKIEVILKRIGFEFQKGQEAFRVFGYAPRDLADFK